MTKNYRIVKRDGKKVAFDVIKIKKVISWACMGIEVNPLELESQVHLQFQDNMSTEQVQGTLINTALSMTNAEDLNNLKWRYVAARLLLLNLYKGAKRTRGYDTFGYGSYYVFLKKAVRYGLYDPVILEEYTRSELKEMGRERNMWYDFDYDYAGMNLMRTRYLMKYEGNTFELPQDMYLSIALLLALPEKKEERLGVAKKIYHALASRKVSPGTPIILNLRRPGGNLASCFITAMDDSLDSIYYTLDQIGQISKNAGGVGMNISRVRSKGSAIKKIKGASGGVLPWIKLVNDTAVAVNQLGSRAGAVTVALDVWHLDVEDFLDMQRENGDQRKKSYDVFPQLVINDLFLKRVEENGKWTLFDPHEVRVKHKIELAELYGSKFNKAYEKLEADDKIEFKKELNAKSLFKEFLRTLVETGMPYVTFKDNMNAMNPNKHCGMIGNGNLCMESFSNFAPSKLTPKVLSEDRTMINQTITSGETHTCNLISLNLAEIDDDETMEETVALAVRILDNTIEVSAPPIPEADKHNNEYRILGIGALGYADYLAKRGNPYPNSGEIADTLFEKIAYYAVKESSRLAKIRGKYPNYEGSDWSKGIFFGKDMKWFKENSKMAKEWEDLKDSVAKNGMRNGGLFAIAPNTSTSLLMGATASVLPIFKKFFIDKASNGAVPIAPPFLNSETFWTYIENQNIEQNHVIDVISSIQKWVDQGISMELILNLKEGIKAKDIYNLYMHAWRKGCKTVYYARSITKTASSEASKKEDC
ncbi:MAG: ribonucleoside-diphosphate reductase subunit alpha, partial [Nanoarchaeota archaeon]|nr:ribonucleoside-diphosphate reductase subunit alpha [Nanoarchaeota archaeon]